MCNYSYALAVQYSTQIGKTSGEGDLISDLIRHYALDGFESYQVKAERIISRHARGPERPLLEVFHGIKEAMLQYYKRTFWIVLWMNEIIGLLSVDIFSSEDYAKGRALEKDTRLKMKELSVRRDVGDFIDDLNRVGGTSRPWYRTPGGRKARP